MSGTGLDAVHWMRRVRRTRRRPSALDVAAIGVGVVIVGVLAISAFRSSDALPSDSVVSMRVASSTAAGMVVLALLSAVSSGARGGPLALGSATVYLVMLAPVDRGAVLRQSAARQLLLGAAAGVGSAVVLWISAASRVESAGSVLMWAVCGATAGVLCVGAALGAAGVRITRGPAMAMRALVVGWWLIDLVLESATSPMVALSRGLFEAPSTAHVLYAACMAGAVGFFAVRRIGGLSVEKAWRRSDTADQLRVAVGLNDLRTAVLILRRRAGESPRVRPWSRYVGPWSRRHPISARSMRALLRWPAARVWRFSTLALATGIAGAASVSLPAAAVAASVFLYVAALDAIDALSQEIDHPDLHRGYPISPERLVLGHLPAPVVIMTSFGALASVPVGIADGLEALVVVLIASPAVAVAAVAGAALTATRTARPMARVSDLALPPELLVPRIVLRFVAPMVPLVAMLVPLAMSYDRQGLSAVLQIVPGFVASVALLAFITLRPALSRFGDRLLSGAT